MICVFKIYRHIILHFFIQNTRQKKESDNFYFYFIFLRFFLLLVRMSGWNVWMAFSNIGVIDTMFKSKSDKLTVAALMFVSSASFISHLFESHKHGMIGFQCDPKLSYLLNRVDVFGAFLLASRIFMITPWSLLLKYLPCFLLCGWLNFFSEFDKTAKTRDVFLVTHTLWHFGIFRVLSKLLEEMSAQ